MNITAEQARNQAISLQNDKTKEFLAKCNDAIDGFSKRSEMSCTVFLSGISVEVRKIVEKDL